MRRSTSTARRACALGTTAALVVLTTGLGIMTATAANAAPSDRDGSVSVQADPTHAVSPTPTDAPSPTDTPTPTSTPSATATPTGESTPTPTKSTAPTFPLLPHLRSSAPAAGDATDAGTTAAVAAPTVTITGDAKVGSTLKASTTGFDKQLGPLEFSWTEQATGNELGTDQYYDVQPTDAGAVIVVTASGVDSAGAAKTATAETTAVSEDVAFLGTDGKPTEDGSTQENALELSATAGEPYSYTFRAQGFPAPKFELSWFSDDEDETEGNFTSTKAQAESTSTIGFGWSAFDDEEFTLEDQLPEGMTFDASTGELSGTPKFAMPYEFAISATNGTQTAEQYVELDVDPGAAYGVAAITLDKNVVDKGEGGFWIITKDGVEGWNQSQDDDDIEELDHVSIKQGGTLLVAGTPVDRYGNFVDLTDPESAPLRTTVTSSVASDVIKPYTEDGAEGEGLTSVTFPHASTHRLTVAAEALQPVSFDVEVTPTVAPAVAVTPTATGTGTGGQLAYTGSDATGALPWALGLVLAGAGLIGARALRRRHAQR